MNTRPDRYDKRFARSIAYRRLNVRWSRTITQNRLTHIVTACGEGSLDIHAVTSGSVFTIFSSASGSPARPCLWDRRLAEDAYFALAFTKTVTHTLELDPGARWSAGRVRVRTDRPVSLVTTTHYGYPGAVQVARQTPATDRRATMAGSGVLGPIPKAESAKRSPNAPIPTEF